MQVGDVLESSGPPLDDGHRDFLNWQILGWEIDENESAVLIHANCISKKKVENFHPQKRLNFRVGYNWQIFNFLIIFWFFVNNSPQNHPNLKYRECFEKITIRRISIIDGEMLDIKKYLGEDVFFSSSRVGDFSSKKC